MPRDTDYENVVVAFRDPTVDGGKMWRVVFGGVLQRPSWPAKSPAEAFLAGLLAGTRKPEPVPASMNP